MLMETKNNLWPDSHTFEPHTFCPLPRVGCGQDHFCYISTGVFPTTGRTLPNPHRVGGLNPKPQREVRRLLTFNLFKIIFLISLTLGVRDLHVLTNY